MKAWIFNPHTKDGGNIPAKYTGIGQHYQKFSHAIVENLEMGRKM
jgi:hypothetical protein